MSRPLRTASFAIDAQWLYVADDTFPAIAQLDRQTGSVQRVFWWEVAPENRELSVSNAVLAHNDEILVSSPSAGGLVRIDIASGATSVIALDEAPGPITVVGDTIWIVADANWATPNEGMDDPPRADPPFDRPVVWAGPHGPDPDSDEDDDYSWDVARPVWRVVGDAAERVDLGGDVMQLTPIDRESFLFVVRRIDDPIVKTGDGYGGASFGYPGALARCDASAARTVLMDLPETSGLLAVDGDRCWLSGFGFELPAAIARPDPFADDPDPLQELDIESGQLTLSSSVIEPDVIIDNRVISIAERYVDRNSRRRVSEARIHNLDVPADPTVVDLPLVVDRFFGGVVVGNGTAWFVSEDIDALVWVDPTAGTTGAVSIDVDLGPSAPAPVPPVGLDLDQFEQSQFAALRESLTAEWVDEDGNPSDFVTNLEIGSVELRGEFPDSHVVVHYRARYRPGIAFARRLNLYDELGNAEEVEDAGMYLEEDIDSGGAPPLEECEPDADGIVWF